MNMFVTTNEIGPSATETINFEKINYQECYRVYYSLGHSILVPINAESITKIF